MPIRWARTSASTDSFNIEAFLNANGVSARTIRFARGAVIFSQGGRATSVFYLQEGSAKLSVLSSAGKEAVVGMLVPGISLARSASRLNRSAWQRLSRSCRPEPFASRRAT